MFNLQEHLCKTMMMWIILGFNVALICQAVDPGLLVVMSGSPMFSHDCNGHNDPPHCDYKNPELFDSNYISRDEINIGTCHQEFSWRYSETGTIGAVINSNVVICGSYVGMYNMKCIELDPLSESWIDFPTMINDHSRWYAGYISTPSGLFFVIFS